MEFSIRSTDGVDLMSRQLAPYLAYLSLLGLVAAWRLMELLISRRNFYRMGKGAVLVKEGVFPWMVLLHVCFFVALPLELALTLPEFGGPISILAALGVATACVLRLWTLTTLGSVWNVCLVQKADHPIISRGPYRFIRHPNYLVVIMEMFFLPLVYKLYWSAGLLSLANGIVLFFRIRREEQTLAEHPRWVAEVQSKPRFLPRISRAGGR